MIHRAWLVLFYVEKMVSDFLPVKKKKTTPPLLPCYYLVIGWSRAWEKEIPPPSGEAFLSNDEAKNNLLGSHMHYGSTE